MSIKKIFLKFLLDLQNIIKASMKIKNIKVNKYINKKIII